MEIKIYSKESIHNNYKLLRKKEYYEPIILNIMNDSKIVFPSQYILIEKQDNGEPDFIDKETGMKYDAKLLFESSVCQALNEDRIEDFINDLMDCIGMDIPTQRENGVKESKLYKEMEKRIKSLKEDEIGILFLPFPVLLISPDMIFAELCSDQFDWCFSNIKTTNKVYLIGMNIEGTIVLKQLRSNKRIEYLENKYFNDKIQTRLVGYETD